MDRKPVQLALVFGATTGLYAVSLACVTELQADRDRDLAAHRSTVAAGVGAFGDANDRLAADIDRVVAAYGVAADAYARTADSLALHDASLAALSAVVSEVSGSAAALPHSAPLPRVARAASRATPTSHATTGAS
jgi:hypothetical protein